MKIIIGGAGDVGRHLAKLLSEESHEITLIDPNADTLAQIEGTLDILAFQGSITSPSLLEKALPEDADIFIAVTDKQDTNIVACILAKKMGAKKVITRVSDAEYLDRRYAMKLHRIGVDVIISPEEQAANEIISLIEDSILTETHSFGNRLLNLFGITLSEHSPIIGKTLVDVLETYASDNQLIPVCIVRHQQQGEQAALTSFVPQADEVFQLDDIVYFIALESARANIYQMSGKIDAYLSNIVILGGGKIGYKAATLLQNAKHRVKLIERDRKKAETIASSLNSKVLVLAGDGRDNAFLEEAGIGETDAFVAMTGRSETNMVACLLAKARGVKKNIALVDNLDYAHLSKAVGIDSFVNKKLLTANAILKYVRRGKVVDVISLYDENANVMEFRINENSQVLGQSLADIDLPEQAIIGGIIRKNQAFIATPERVIERFDRVVIFAHSACISHIESLF